MHERGFAGASVRDIVEAAKVPQGSFTNHFASKEAFCFEILDLYFEGTRAMIDETGSKVCAICICSSASSSLAMGTRQEVAYQWRAVA